VLATLIDTIGPTLFRRSTLKYGLSDQNLNTRIYKGKHSFIRYRVAGTAGPTLVISPDPPVMIEHYNELIDRLTNSGYRVIIFEMPGFGFSLPKLGFNFRLESITFDIVSLLTQLDIGPYFLMFPCVPGFVAVHIADRFPNLIAGLVLVQLPNQQQAYAWRDLRDPKGILQTPVIGQVALQILKKRRMKDWYAASLGNKDMVRAFTETSTCGLNHGACFCLASGFQRLLNDLPEWKPLDKPTLILWGGIDKTHKHTNMSSTKELVVNATYIEMMGSGHFPDLEESEKVIEFLNDFIF
jgi:pimeloyl-ACP methyl ester carboxylesterase